MLRALSTGGVNEHALSKLNEGDVAGAVERVGNHTYELLRAESIRMEQEKTGGFLIDWWSAWFVKSSNW